MRTSDCLDEVLIMRIVSDYWINSFTILMDFTVVWIKIRTNKI